MKNNECDYYEKGGICSVTGEKCVGAGDWDCPASADCYDPYIAGDCEDF